MTEYYKIADLVLGINFPQNISTEELLPSFCAFRLDNSDHQTPFMHIDILVETFQYDETPKLLKEASYVLEYQFRLEETLNYYVVTIIGEGNENTVQMRCTKDFRENYIYTSFKYLMDPFRFKWMIMIAFGQCILQENGILIHASAVISNELGYAFLGVSGTGKSTHSNLWIQNIPDTELLNDDNPILRIMDDGNVWIYGSPWSGKTNCYKAAKRPLRALVRLEQAPFNQLKRLDQKKALFALLPSGSAIPWNDNLFQLMVDHLSYVAEKIYVGHLFCLPNNEAAKLCYSEVV